MAALLEIAAFGAVVDDGDFRRTAFFYELSGDFRAFDERRAYRGFGAVVYEEDVIEGNLATLCLRELFDAQDRALGNEVLLSAGLNYSYFCHISRSTIQKKPLKSKYVAQNRLISPFPAIPRYQPKEACLLIPVSAPCSRQ